MYKLSTEPDVVQRLFDKAWIPFSMGNKDYLEYLEWLEAGNTPEPADEETN